MARRTCDYTVTDAGRDRGKRFLITEMPASVAEAWAMRALLAIAQGGVQLPEGFERRGWAGMVEAGIRALTGLRWEVAEPLLAEMWQCVAVVPDPSKPHVQRPLIEEDVEEIATRIKLRAEIWKLHADFLKAVAPSIFAGSPAPAASTPNTKTSRARSRR